MKRIKINLKEYILVTPKELKRMIEWYWMASNCGDNDTTKQDTSLQEKGTDILDTIKEETKYGVIYTHFKK